MRPLITCLGFYLLLASDAWSQEEPVTSLKNYRGEYRLSPSGLPLRPVPRLC